MSMTCFGRHSGLFQTVEAMAPKTPIFLRQICTTSWSCARPIWLTEARRLKTPQLPRDRIYLKKSKVTQISALLQTDFKSSGSILYDYDVSHCLLSTIDSYNFISGNMSITVSGKKCCHDGPAQRVHCCTSMLWLLPAIVRKLWSRSSSYFTNVRSNLFYNWWVSFIVKYCVVIKGKENLT